MGAFAVDRFAFLASWVFPLAIWRLPFAEADLGSCGRRVISIGLPALSLAVSLTTSCRVPLGILQEPLPNHPDGLRPGLDSTGISRH